MSLIHQIPKNNREAFYFTTEEFQGRDYFSIRIWYDAGEEYKPTQKGVTVPIAKLNEFIEGIEALKCALSKVEESR